MKIEQLKQLARSHNHQLRILAAAWMNSSPDKREPVSEAIEMKIFKIVATSAGIALAMFGTAGILTHNTRLLWLFAPAISCLLSAMFAKSAFIQAVSLLETAPSLGQIYGSDPASFWLNLPNVADDRHLEIWAKIAEREILEPLATEVRENERFSWEKRKARKLKKKFMAEHAMLLRLLPVEKDHKHYFSSLLVPTQPKADPKAAPPVFAS